MKLLGKHQVFLLVRKVLQMASAFQSFLSGIHVVNMELQGWLQSCSCQFSPFCSGGKAMQGGGVLYSAALYLQQLNMHQITFTAKWTGMPETLESRPFALYTVQVGHPFSEVLGTRNVLEVEFFCTGMPLWFRSRTHRGCRKQWRLGHLFKDGEASLALLQQGKIRDLFNIFLSF